MDAAAVTIVLFNLAFWVVMFVVQSWEAKTNRIPPRRPHNKARPQEGFLYLQDYHTTSWGDLIALSLIDAAVAATASAEQALSIAVVVAIISLPAGIIITAFFVSQWLSPAHKPDWAYPRTGETSRGGKLHTLYFAIQLSATLSGIWFLTTGGFSLWQAVAFVVGGLAYLLAMVLDTTSKRWTKIPSNQ